MATPLAIDPNLLDRAFLVSGEKTKNAVVMRPYSRLVSQQGYKRRRGCIHRLRNKRTPL